MRKSNQFIPAGNRRTPARNDQPNPVRLEKRDVMAGNPQQIADATSKIVNAWTTLAPAATFGGMTLAQYKTKVQPSFDARAQIVTLGNQLTAAGDARDDADKDTVSANQLVVNAVKGDPNFGDDSDLYDAMGYTRRSERASGLSRGKTPAPAAAQK